MNKLDLTYRRDSAERIIQNCLLSEAKLRENDKILEAHDRGEFPVDQGSSSQARHNTTAAISSKGEVSSCTVNFQMPLVQDPPIAVRAAPSIHSSSSHYDSHAVMRGSYEQEKQVQIQSIANDEAIAVALQEELKMSSHRMERQPYEKDDYHYARQLQEQLDSETAQTIQQQQTTSQHYHSVYGKDEFRGYTKLVPKGRPLSYKPQSFSYDTTHGETSDTSSESNRGATIPTSSESNRGATSGIGVTDMSYEVLSELEDVPNGLSYSEMNRYTRTTLYDQAKEKTKAPCSICYDEFNQDQQLRILPCFHKFHRHCIEKWLTEKPTCPFCLKSIK